MMPEVGLAWIGSQFTTHALTMPGCHCASPGALACMASPPSTAWRLSCSCVQAMHGPLHGALHG
eukprot:364575-Chlamydomonas_euryale.AAC.6